jgi:hypothetical protein
LTRIHTVHCPFLVSNMAADAPLTLDSSKIYAGAAWFYMAAIASLGLLGA